MKSCRLMDVKEGQFWGLMDEKEVDYGNYGPKKKQ